MTSKELTPVLIVGAIGVGAFLFLRNRNNVIPGPSSPVQLPTLDLGGGGSGSGSSGSDNGLGNNMNNDVTDGGSNPQVIPTGDFRPSVTFGADGSILVGGQPYNAPTANTNITTGRTGNAAPGLTEKLIAIGAIASTPGQAEFTRQGLDGGRVLSGGSLQAVSTNSLGQKVTASVAVLPGNLRTGVDSGTQVLPTHGDYSSVQTELNVTQRAAQSLLNFFTPGVSFTSAPQTTNNAPAPTPAPTTYTPPTRGQTPTLTSIPGGNPFQSKTNPIPSGSPFSGR